MIYIFVLILIFIGIYEYDLTNRSFSSSKKNTLYYTIAFILFFIAAFRYYNGGDTENYAEHFLQIPSWEELSDHHFDDFRYQKGYIYFVSFIKGVWNNFLIQQILTALIVNAVVFRFIKRNSPFVFLTTLMYFILNYFEFNMEIMRECISVALGLLAYECLKSRRYVLMAILIYIAYQFHISALILILMPLFAIVKFSKKSFFIVLVIAILLPALYVAIPNLELYANLLFNQEDWVNDAYLIQEYSDTLSTNYYVTHILKFLFIPFVILWYVNKKVKFEFTGMVYAYALLQLLSMFSYAFYRFANYFAPFYWIAISYAIYLLISKQRELRTIILSFILILMIYLHQNVQFSWDSNNNQYYYNRYIPYESVFFNEGYK
ncbi:MAG: EpsG family protein [Rikenellaceae bacterium]|nr:EpsG family protein [Rikenellaceae bacterium]